MLLIRIFELLKQKKYFILSILSIPVMAVLSFVRLGDRFMWIDESLTAMLGKNILKFGIPKVWDGVNLVTTNNGNDFNNNLIFIKENWLPFYVSAFSQLFGSSNFWLRFWFVVCGVLSLLVFYLLAKLLFDDQKVVLLSLWLYGLSVPIILYIRQVRYYALGILFFNLTLFFYFNYVKSKNKYMWIGFICSFVLLFYTQYMFFSIALIVLFIYFILFDQQKLTWRKFIKGMTAIAFGILPWIIYVSSNGIDTGGSLYTFFGFKYLTMQALGYIWQIQAYFFPFVTLVVIWLIIFLSDLYKRRENIKTSKYGFDGVPLSEIDNHSLDNNSSEKNHCKLKYILMQKRNTILLLLIIIVNVFAASAFTVQYCTRFLIPCLPACFLLCSSLLVKICSKAKQTGYILIALALFTNTLNVTPYYFAKLISSRSTLTEAFIKPPIPFFKAQYNWPFDYNLSEYIDKFCYTRSYLFDYLYEIGHDYNDANEGMIRFLWKYAASGDTVMVYHGADQDSIAYYTGLKVVNRLTQELNYFPDLFSKYPNAKKYYNLTAYPEDNVDWIIMRPYDDSANNSELFFYDQDLYERIEIRYPEAPSLPDIWFHSFWTDYCYPDFYIYKNLNTKTHVNITKHMGESIFDSTDSVE